MNRKIIGVTVGTPISPESLRQKMNIEQTIEDYLAANPPQESDPTVPSWAKQPEKPEYTAEEIGAQPIGDYATKDEIPAKLSQLENDEGYISDYTETDPTVPAWAKASSKPSYTKSEVGLGNVDNVKQYSASNPPPYPVTKVNNKTGEVSLAAFDVGARPNTWTPSYSDVGAVKSSGWSANKNLGTDESGNVIEKEDIFSKDTSAWKPVEYLDGVSWTELGYYWTANGTHTNTSSTQKYQSTQELVRIEPNCSYTLSNFTGIYFLYDIDGKNGVRIADPHYNANEPVNFETNANQYYIGISHQPTTGYPANGVSLVRNNISEAEYNALPTRADSLKTLYGKTVVCFGDSLFGMYRGEDSAPAFVAAETGATVYNVGFGGCRMSVHPTSGYAAFSMWALAKAIAENNWTTQDAQAASGSAYFPEQLALLKSIDFSKVDIAVIHYGTNDFGAGNAVELDNTADHDDYTTLCGALRYSVEKLLSANPKLRIYISLPVYRFWTENGSNTYAETYIGKSGKTLPEFVEALRSTAAEYNLPVIDGYYGLGINKANAATFLSDGTHHNATGRERFGRFIGANLTAQQTSAKSGIDTAAVQAMIDASIAAIPIYNGEVV